MVVTEEVVVLFSIELYWTQNDIIRAWWSEWSSMGLEQKKIEILFGGCWVLEGSMSKERDVQPEDPGSAFVVTHDDFVPAMLSSGKVVS